MRPSLLLLAALLACGPPEPELPPVPPEQAAARVREDLESAVYLHGNGHDDAAVQAWLSARRTFRESVLPALRERQGHQRSVRAEYLLGRVRHELDRPGGKPAPLVEEIHHALEDLSPPTVAGGPP